MNTDKLKRTILETEDGSHTIFVPELNEHYHSIHGAIQESSHVFIESGLRFLNAIENISIFEVGFGTGLNALLTLEEAKKEFKNIHYTTIEKYPLTDEEVLKLNYRQFLDKFGEDFKLLHQAPWNEWVQIGQRFALKKITGDLVNFIPTENYHLVFFDAFAPSLQPYLWSETIFKQLYDAMHKHGVVVTYSAKGFVKRNLKAAGFEVTKIPGPPGKREMIRAIKL